MSATVLPCPTNLTEALTFYKALGLPCTPVRPGEKRGYRTGWSESGHCAAPSAFRASDNIGVLNGTQPREGWFFHDIDIDANSDGARAIVRELLPATGWCYGRPGKPQSHLNYLVKARPLLTAKYCGLGGKSNIELRGITKKGTHTLSVGPGSTHETGEPIRFCEPLGPIGRVEDPDAFALAVKDAAVALLIFEVWPPQGTRHNLRLALAKVLLEREVSRERATAILRAVMHATGSNADDVADAVRSTEEALRDGEPTAGASIVCDVLGDELGGKLLKGIAKILPQVHEKADEASDIVMRGGELSRIVNRSEEALLATDSSIFQRGGVLVRPVKLDAPVRGDGIRRQAGATVLIAVREAWLVERMGQVVRWFRADGHTLSDPQPIYARTLLSRGEWRFPALRGVLTAPTLDGDGRIIAAPGFDERSGLLLDIAPGAFPPVPVTPTVDDARVALDNLAHLLRGFPFVTEGGRSVALSALLTALVRASLRTAPLHGFDSPTPGTGKSLLAEMAGLLATGVRPPALSQGKSEEEDEKRLATVAAAGDPVILIDNCERQVAGDFLCSMLTQSVVQVRILGQSERRVFPTTALVLATGNNLTLAGDVARRAVVCRLDAGVERPDTRKFDFDCQAELLAARPELVVAGLTILRAYHIAGRPVVLTPMGSFADWEWVRGALVWLGCADPAETRDAIFENDPRKDELVAVIELWEQALGDTPVEVAEIEKRAVGYSEDHAVLMKRDDMKVLFDKLVEVACRGAWNGKSVGWWLRRHKDRVVGGRCLRAEPSRNGMRWWLAEVASEHQGPAPEAVVLPL